MNTENILGVANRIFGFVLYQDRTLDDDKSFKRFTRDKEMLYAEYLKNLPPWYSFVLFIISFIIVFLSFNFFTFNTFLISIIPNNLITYNTIYKYIP